MEFFIGFNRLWVLLNQTTMTYTTLKGFCKLQHHREETLNSYCRALYLIYLLSLESQISRMTFICSLRQERSQTLNCFPLCMLLIITACIFKPVQIQISYLMINIICCEIRILDKFYSTENFGLSESTCEPQLYVAQF